MILEKTVKKFGWPITYIDTMVEIIMNRKIQKSYVDS
jgi:hypothetical protein